MSGVAIEDLLELWSAELRKAKAKLSWLIEHPSVVASAAAFLDTLLGPERRKTGWMRAEAAGDAGPWRQQAVLGRSHWDADALRDVVRDYALETLAEGDAVLVIDESGFLKQGTASCGVARLPVSFSFQILEAVAFQLDLLPDRAAPWTMPDHFDVQPLYWATLSRVISSDGIRTTF
jgi:hypothetical protein